MTKVQRGAEVVTVPLVFTSKIILWGLMRWMFLAKSRVRLPSVSRIDKAIVSSTPSVGMRVSGIGFEWLRGCD